MIDENLEDNKNACPCLNTSLGINKDDAFTLSLPYYPSPGSETIIDEPGYYKGYFCNFCPNAGTPYDFKPPVDWNVISCSQAEFGAHGCCYYCNVVLIELEYIGVEIEEPTEPESSSLIKYGIILVALLGGLKLFDKK